MPFPTVLRMVVAAAIISPAMVGIHQSKAQSGEPTIDYKTYQEALKKGPVSGVPAYENYADERHQFLKSPEYRRRLANLSDEIRKSTGQFCSDITVDGNTPQDQVKSGIEMYGVHNESVALCSFASAAMAGNAEAMGWYGMLIKDGKRVPADAQQAAEAFKLSADAGGPGEPSVAQESCDGSLEENYQAKQSMNISNHLARTALKAKNYRNTACWAAMGEKQGDRRALTTLGIVFTEPGFEGVNYDRAFQYLKRATDMGDIDMG